MASASSLTTNLDLSNDGRVTILSESEAVLQWDGLVTSFQIPAFHQSYCWGEYQSARGWHPLRCVFSSARGIWGIAQCLVKMNRFFRAAVIWIPGGPLLKEVDWNRFRENLAQLFHDWRLYIRIDPPSPASDLAVGQVEASGWNVVRRRLNSGKTVLVSLDEEEQVRRSRLSSNWRHNLVRGERQGLLVECWQGDGVAEALFGLYREMVSFKRISLAVKKRALHSMVQAIGQHSVVVVARDSKREVIAARAGGWLGLHGCDLFAATSRAGRKSYASYVALWRLLEELRQYGVKTYDLGGVDPIKAPGIYHFKRGTGGVEVQRLGEWEWSQPETLKWAVNAWVWARTQLRT